MKHIVLNSISFMILSDINISIFFSYKKKKKKLYFSQNMCDQELKQVFLINVNNIEIKESKCK